MLASSAKRRERFDETHEGLAASYYEPLVREGGRGGRVEDGVMFEMIYLSPTMLLLWGCHVIMRRRDELDGSTVLTVSYFPPPLYVRFL